MQDLQKVSGFMGDLTPVSNIGYCGDGEIAEAAGNGCGESIRGRTGF